MEKESKESSHCSVQSLIKLKLFAKVDVKRAKLYYLKRSVLGKVPASQIVTEEKKLDQYDLLESEEGVVED